MARMSDLLTEVRNIEEGFASDAQRRAAFASGYKAKGKKGKKEDVELDELNYQFMVLDKDGRVMGMTTGEKDADRQAKGDNIRGETGRVVKLRGRGVSQRRGDSMIGHLPADNLGEALDKKDEPKVKGIIKKLKKASDAHAGQASDLEKAINEDGHVDVASAVRQCKTIVEDATQMMSKLQGMSPEDSLPTWWTNKLAVASNSMNKMRDYLLVPSVSEEVELDEGKMKELSMYIDDIANEMAKNKMMKPFASKFKADAIKSMNPRKSLEKVLPDYVAGKEIAKLLNMGMGEEKINEILPLVVRAAPAVAKAVSKINPSTIGSTAATVATGAQRAKDYISKKAKAVKKRITGEDVQVIEGYFPEAKSSTGYDLYHNDFSSAMQHAYDHAKKKYGITIDKSEIDDKVATGPRKPTRGKTNSYRLKGDKGAVRIQVYNMGNKFELNMYKEEVEIQEKFTMKDFKDNEDANDHTENGVKLVNMYGTPAEKKLMAQIAKNHNRRGSIEKKEQELRDKLIKKYYLRLESVELDESMADLQRKLDKLYGPKITKGMADLQKKLDKLYGPKITKDIAMMLKDKKYKGNTSAFDAAVKKKYPKEYNTNAVQDLIRKHAEMNEQYNLDEGYESEVLKVLRDADIEGYFKNNKLYVSKRDARDAKKALEDSDDITKLPKMVMEEVELDEAGSQGMFLVIQGENDNKQKVISMHKRKADAIKARDAWNDKNKPTKRTHKARVYEVGKFATTDGKPKTFKVGDNVMYSDFARSIVKEEVDPADVDITATDKDVENASKNIILQLRKVITLRGMKPVEFASGKEKVNPNIAQKALSIHQNLRRTDEKDAFQRKIARSYKDLLNAVKGRK
jgi:hypothetical protein